jgi:hypothetical protein
VQRGGTSFALARLTVKTNYLVKNSTSLEVKPIRGICSKSN